MNVLATQIIEVSIQLAQPVNENLKHHHSIRRQLRDSKNGFISELMTLIAECRKMSLNQNDKASLDTAINRLNKKLYEATSLTIL
ncbi:MAG: hypothetical protein HMLIMOIP_001350 [Candidatus Nitrosomirales archaeon]|jgi:hypothetical protein